MNRYETLASQIEDEIRRGILISGERMPSVRELSSREKVSPSTVVEAYGLLAERGWIQARPRSGFFVSRQPSPTPPPSSRARQALVGEGFALEPSDLVFALRQAAHDPKIIPFGAAMAGPAFFPYRAIARSISRVLRDEPALSSEYVFPPGSLALRQAIASRFHRFGVAARAEDVVTAGGATEAICLALRAVAQPGDVVLLESPTYFGILQIVNALGYSVLEVPAHPSQGLEPAKFEEALRRMKGRVKAAIVTPNHSNPLGARIPDAAKAELVRIAARERVVLIEDDVYGELPHDGVRPKPLKAFDRSEAVILCSSFSKTIAPGLRVGFVMSSRHAKALSLLRSSTGSGVAIVAEETIAHYLSEGGFDRHLRRVRREYATLVARFSSALRQALPEGTRINEPLGGYVLWLQLPGGMDSRLLQKRALAEGISVASGAMFSAQGAYRDCLRICCALPWGRAVERGIERLGKVVRSCL
ncbi:MAG TPA: PLP-dependent aminotransferase family protein [Bdellovibrionota bacterium]|nr:PLP-dependent aminotransferase family protein [Bdellovibrionota bacterium]